MRSAIKNVKRASCGLRGTRGRATPEAWAEGRWEGRGSPLCRFEWSLWAVVGRKGGDLAVGRSNRRQGIDDKFPIIKPRDGFKTP